MGWFACGKGGVTRESDIQIDHGDFTWEGNGWDYCHSLSPFRGPTKHSFLIFDLQPYSWIVLDTQYSKVNCITTNRYASEMGEGKITQGGVGGH